MLLSGAKCCTFYSIAGVIFLVFSLKSFCIVADHFFIFMNSLLLVQWWRINPCILKGSMTVKRDPKLVMLEVYRDHIDFTNS